MVLEDGRYLDRDPEETRVLVVETEGAPPPARRKRRRPRKSGPDRQSGPLPLTVVTVVFTGEKMDGPAAAAWLRAASAEPAVTGLFEAALATLERGLAAASVATGAAVGEPPSAREVTAARVGYGPGGEVYEGRYSEAMEIDPAGGSPGGRQHRLEQIVPLARIAATLAGREPVRACEILVPRVRVDLDCGRLLPAALVTGEAVRATIAELEFALEDPDHERDLDRLERLLPGLLGLPARILGEGEPAAGTAARSELTDQVREALELAERVIRRYRITTQ